MTEQYKAICNEIREFFSVHPEIFEVEQKEVGTENEFEHYVRITAAFVAARIVDALPLCPPHKKLEETHGLMLQCGECLACSLNKGRDALDDLKTLEGSCWSCLHVGDPWRHEHEPEGGHWHHYLDPGDGLPSACENSDMLERLFSEFSNYQKGLEHYADKRHWHVLPIMKDVGADNQIRRFFNNGDAVDGWTIAHKILSGR